MGVNVDCGTEYSNSLRIFAIMYAPVMKTDIRFGSAIRMLLLQYIK